MSLQQLLSTAPPPENPNETGSSKAWEKIDQRLGVKLPKDYKNLINHYGTGSFNDSITLFNPFAGNESLNLFHALETHHKATQMAQLVVDSNWTAIQPFELYPAHHGLLPWGSTENFEKNLFWKVDGVPKKWATVFYDLRNGEYEIWKMPCTKLLAGIFTGEIQSVLLPEDYSSNNKSVVFKPDQEVTL
jgi:hypothetical protein